MPGFLRQATASQSKIIGPFLDDTDFKTAETGLTIANTDIKLMANGGSSANKNSGGGTHRVNGMYSVTFDATDTATVGSLDVSVVVAGALPVFDRFTVLEEAVYDALFAASAPGYVANAPVNVAQISGDATAADNCEAFFDGTGYAGTNNVIPTVSTLTGHTPQTGDAYARLGAPAGASVSADVAAVKAQTAAIETDTQDIQSKIGTPGDLGGGATLAANAADMAGGTFSSSTDSLEALRNRGDSAWITATGFSTHSAADVWSVATRVLTANTNLNDPTAAAIADAVWLETLADHSGTAGSTAAALSTASAAGDPWGVSIPGAYGAGTAGYIVGNNLNAPVGTVDTVVDAIKAVTDLLPDAGALSSLATASAVTTVDTVVDAIKVKTDSLNFTVAGQVDANIQYVNDVAVTGNGQSGTEWGPA